MSEENRISSDIVCSLSETSKRAEKTQKVYSVVRKIIYEILGISEPVPRYNGTMEVSQNTDLLGTTHIWFRGSDMLFCTIESELIDVRFIETVEGIGISVKHPNSISWKRINVGPIYSESILLALKELESINKNMYLIFPRQKFKDCF